jgi:adenosylcobyric acid synthase
MLQIDGRGEGAISADGRISGTYVHGLFTSDRFRQAILNKMGADAGAANYDAVVDTTLDALADHLETHMDVDALLEIARHA